MRSTTSWILFFGLCLTFAGALSQCGGECQDVIGQSGWCANKIRRFPLRILPQDIIKDAKCGGLSIAPSINDDDDDDDDDDCSCYKCKQEEACLALSLGYCSDKMIPSNGEIVVPGLCNDRCKCYARGLKRSKG